MSGLRTGVVSISGDCASDVSAFMLAAPAAQLKAMAAVIAPASATWRNVFDCLNFMIVSPF
jgi:hypothetical protein